MVDILITFVISTLFGMLVMGFICTDDLKILYDDAYECGYADGLKEGAESERSRIFEAVEEMGFDDCK